MKMNTLANRIVAAVVSGLVSVPFAMSFAGTANAGFFFPSLVPGVEQIDTLDTFNTVVNWGPQTAPGTGWYFVSSPIPSGSALTFSIHGSSAVTVTEPTLTSGALSVLLPTEADIVLELATTGLPITMAFEISDSPDALRDPLASATPLPATLPLFAGGLGFVGFLARRKKRETSPLATA